MSQPPSDLHHSVRHNARIGIFLFLIYLIIYAGFVALSAFAPAIMAKPVIGGVNLAVVYGFVLIGLALVLAISFFLGRKAKTARGYFAAHGQIGWFVNGVAFAGDYLSAASFLGICGM